MQQIELLNINRSVLSVELLEYPQVRRFDAVLFILITVTNNGHRYRKKDDLSISYIFHDVSLAQEIPHSLSETWHHVHCQLSTTICWLE